MIIIKDADIVQTGSAKPFRGSIAIEGGLIKQVCGTDELTEFKAETVIDGRGFIAMPGLVNAHAHSPMGIFRNLADDLPFDEWLFNTIIPAEAKLTEEDIYWGAMLGIAEMLKSGTTCFADMYLHMDSVAQAVSETGIRANISYGPITSDVRGGGLIVDAEKCSRFIKKWNNAGNGRIKSFLEIHSVYLFDRPSITDAALLAKELSTGIHIHLSESDAELSMSAEKYNLTPLEAAYDMGVMDTNVIAAHCVKLSDRDMEILRKSNVSPVHCPSSNLKLGNGLSPVPILIGERINVCLGTDGSASNNNLNMLEEMHLAALIHKGYNQNPVCLPATDVIDMATVNGAKALGFNETGKIEQGYSADIVLIDTRKPHICPTNNVRSAICYSVQAGDVDTVIVGGEVLLRGGKLVRMDEEAILNKVREISERICG